MPVEKYFYDKTVWRFTKDLCQKVGWLNYFTAGRKVFAGISTLQFA